MRYLILAMRTPRFQQSAIGAHLEYLSQLREQGILEMAGPFADESGGAYVIEAEDIKTAKAIAFRDPLHATGSSLLSVYEWRAA